MVVTRRRVLAAAVAMPALLVASRVMTLAVETTAAAIRAARPAPDGTTATRCAQCGAPDHTMLDPICPMAPRVLG